MKRAAPRRTCLGCRQVRPQDEMVRLTRGADGRARVDMGARQTGRGAYACPTEDCLRGALRKGRLDHALRRATKAPEAGVDEILKQLGEPKARRQLIGEPQPKARRQLIGEPQPKARRQLIGEPQPKARRADK